MRRIRLVSRPPQPAFSLAPEVVLTFIIDVLTSAVPMFTNKNPQNSINTTTTPSTAR